MSDWLDEFWGDILSEEPLRIVASWVTLATDEQESILAHLRRMVVEAGWADVQRDAARVALSAILGDTTDSSTPPGNSHDDNAPPDR